MALGCGCEDATSVSGESDHFCLHAYNNHIRLSRRHRKGGKYLDKRKRDKGRKEGHVSINTRPRLDTNLSPSPQQEVKIQERTKKGESNNDSLTMGRAHTFPLPTKLSAATLQERRAGTWTTTVEVVAACKRRRAVGVLLQASAVVVERGRATRARQQRRRSRQGPGAECG